MKRALTTMLVAAGLLMPANVFAYTLVLRSGARVDVGDAYRLDGSRIEYVNADGKTQNLNLATVDLQATARENNETVAAFVTRASRRAAPSARQEGEPGSEPTLTITSADLEPYRIQREQLDAEYEARHPEAQQSPIIRYPSRTAQQVRYAGPSLQQWRDEARIYRDQLDAEQAQIDSLKAQVAERQKNPLDFGLSYRYNFGNAPILVRNGTFYSLTNPLYPSLRADEEFAQLNSRLIDVELQHKATLARYDNFLERARRAGVPPGWLRE